MGDQAPIPGSPSFPSRNWPLLLPGVGGRGPGLHLRPLDSRCSFRAGRGPGPVPLTAHFVTGGLLHETLRRSVETPRRPRAHGSFPRESGHGGRSGSRVWGCSWRKTPSLGRGLLPAVPPSWPWAARRTPPSARQTPGVPWPIGRRRWVSLRVEKREPSSGRCVLCPQSVRPVEAGTRRDHRGLLQGTRRDAP